MVSDLMQDDVVDLPVKELGVMAVDALERPAVDRDPIRRART